MLIEQAVPAQRRSLKKPLWIVGIIFVVLIAILLVVAVTQWPFTKQAVTQALRSASGRPVEIGTFTSTYFPPGCKAENIRFLHIRQKDQPPLIVIRNLVIQGSFTGMFTSPKRLAAVRIVGMHVLIPAKQPDGETKSVVYLNSGSGGKSLAISKIVADGATLEFLPEKPDDKSYLLKIDRLAVTDVGAGTRMSYRVALTNSEPPGVINAEGKFGPWDPANAGATPVSGNYTYDNIDLSIFHGIAGMGHARGKFSGPLGHIATRGSVNVAGFHVDGSDHAVELSTTYDAAVNGTNGDVFLNPAIASYRRTKVEVRGSIAGQPNQKGKTASFDLSVPNGRVDDLLLLFTKGQPGMSGDATVTGKFLWPPGPRKFVEKISMDLAFGIGGSRLASHSAQESINRISESAQGESRKQLDEDPRTVLSQLRGNIQLRNGVATITGASFSVPGADATLHGTYSLTAQRVNLQGTLDTRGSLSDTVTGFKAVVLKAVTPLFKKKNSMRIVPFNITGTYSNTSVSIDWKRDLSHR